jgi:hypothetical protein
VRLARIILTALVVAVCVPSVGSAQYAPKWHVGDWWIVKSGGKSRSGSWVWSYMRYNITGVEKVDGRDCLVLETRRQSRPDGAPARTSHLFSVRKEDWLVVRDVSTRMYSDTLLPPETLNCPLGLFGPFRAGEPRLPRFPLQLGNTDTTFKLQKLDYCAADLREISSVADSALVSRLLDDGDTTGGRVVRPTGVVYQVRNELSGTEQIVQSLQFWCDDLPWRLYEEFVQYDGPHLTKHVVGRSWLIASGRAGR